MTEKIMNEEIMNVEELEEISGGTRREIQRDIAMLRHYRIIGPNQVPNIKQINDGILAIGQRAGIKVGYNPSKNAHNKYYDNHNTKTQEEFWNKIRRRLGY